MSSADRPIWPGVEPGARVTSSREIGSNHNHDLGLARELICRRRRGRGGRRQVPALPRRVAVSAARRCGGHADGHGGPARDVRCRGAAVRVAASSCATRPATRRSRSCARRLTRPPSASSPSSTCRRSRSPRPSSTTSRCCAAAARLRRPLICSTGLSTIGDIAEAIAAVEAEWPDPEVVLLQCASAYPLPPEQADLRVIETLRHAFGVPTGLSDHTMDAERSTGRRGGGGRRAHREALHARPLPARAPTTRSPSSRTSCAGWSRASVSSRRCASTSASRTVDAALRGRDGDPGRRRKRIMPAEAGRCTQTTSAASTPYATSPPARRCSAENLRVLRSERNLVPGLHPALLGAGMWGRRRRGARRGRGPAVAQPRPHRRRMRVRTAGRR